MKKVLSLLIVLAMLLSCVPFGMMASAELAEGAPFTAYDGEYALKVAKYQDGQSNFMPKVNLNSLSNSALLGQYVFDVSVTYRLGDTDEVDSNIFPIVGLFYNESYWRNDYAVCNKDESPVISADGWVTVSGTVDASGIIYAHKYDQKEDKADTDNILIGAAILLHGIESHNNGNDTGWNRDIQSDLYIDKVVVKLNGETILDESYENGNSTTYGQDCSPTITVEHLGETPKEIPVDFSAYEGEFALKIKEYTSEQSGYTVKTNLDDLAGMEYPEGDVKFFVSVTYRLGGENLSDSGIAPVLKLFYNSGYWANEYTVSSSETVTSDKWTTVSGIVDATDIKTAETWDDSNADVVDGVTGNNSLFGAALLLHGQNAREISSDLYVDEIIVRQIVDENGSETQKDILHEGYEGLYDSSVAFVKNKTEGDNCKPTLEFVKLGKEQKAPIAADVATVAGGKRAVKIVRNGIFWNSSISFGFWDSAVHSGIAFETLDFNVSADLYNYGDKDMDVYAAVYVVYAGDWQPYKVGESEKITLTPGDWIDFEKSVTATPDSSKSIGKTVIMIGEDSKGYDYAMDNLVITCSAVNNGATDVCKGYGDFESTDTATGDTVDDNWNIIHEADNLIARTSNPFIGVNYWMDGKTAESGQVYLEHFEGVEHEQTLIPVTNGDGAYIDAQSDEIKLDVYMPITRSRYSIAEYGVLFHRNALLNDGALALETPGAVKAAYEVIDGDTLPAEFTATLNDNGKSHKGYINTEYAARPYVIYNDSVTGGTKTVYGEQTAKRSRDSKTMQLGDFVNKVPFALDMTEASNYYLTSEMLLAAPMEGTEFRIELNDDYRVGFIASPGAYMNSEEDGSINKGIVKWMQNGDTYSLHYLYLYFRVFVTHKNNIGINGDVNNIVEVTDIASTGLKLNYESSADVISDNVSAMAAIYNARNGYAVLTHGSDVHGDVVRLDNMMRFSDAIGADFAAVTGDITAYSKATGFSAAVNTMLGRKTPVLAAVGNHDVGFMPATAESDANKYNQLISKLSAEYGYANDAAKTYYYMDSADKKLRVIVLDQYEREGVANADYWDMKMSEAQISFFINALNSTPNGYSVIVAYHAPEKAIGDYTNTDNTFYQGVSSSADVPSVISDIVDAYIGRTTLSTSYEAYGITVNADFSAASGTFVAHLTGHFHADTVAYVPGTASKQLMLNVPSVTASKGVLNGNSLAEDSDLVRNKSDYTGDCFNTYIIDTASKQVIVIRVGADTLKTGAVRKYMTASYAD